MNRSSWTFFTLVLLAATPLRAENSPAAVKTVLLAWQFKQDPKHPETSIAPRQQVILVLSGAVNRHVSTGFYGGRCQDAREGSTQAPEGAFFTAVCLDGSRGDEVVVFRADAGLQVQHREMDDNNGFGALTTLLDIKIPPDTFIKI
jgi:hypothetical protein